MDEFQEELRIAAARYRAGLDVVDRFVYDMNVFVKLHFALTGAMACPLPRYHGCGCEDFWYLWR